MTFFRDISFKLKLFICFFIIVVINFANGYFNLNNIEKLSSIVSQTYNKAFMAATFSQSAKFHFSELDSMIKKSIFTENLEDFEKQEIYIDNYFKTIHEDLDVISSRGLDPTKTKDRIEKVKESLEKLKILKTEILNEKKLSLTNKRPRYNEINEFKNWSNNKLRRRLLRLLTRVHDFAAEEGYLFRLDSEKTSKKSVETSLISFVVSTVCSLFLSIFISYLIISPLNTLKKVCVSVENGNLDERSLLNSKDEFGKLSKALNFMLDTIKRKSDNITSLLAALPFGLFYVDKDGQISKEMSPATKRIFKNFDDVNSLDSFYDFYKGESKSVSKILQATFKGMMPFKSTTDLFPNDFEMFKDDEVRNIKLSFSSDLDEEKNLEKVIILAEDYTEKKKAITERDEQFEKVNKITKVSADVKNFKYFVDKSLELLRDSRKRLDNIEEIEDLKRNLHTLKGMLGVYAFVKTVNLTHEIEQELIDTSVIELDNFIELEELFINEVEEVYNVLSINEDPNIIQLNRDVYNDLLNSKDEGSIKEKISVLNKFPISSVFNRYNTYINSTIKKFEDVKFELSFGKDSSQMTFEQGRKVDPILIHLINNTISHGFEDTSIREKKGKKPFNTIDITFKEQGSQCEIIYVDDGGGIDPDIVKEKAVEKGLISSDEAKSLNEKESLNLIFASGFSSKDIVSEIAGRGVGLDVVKNMIEELDGTIDVLTVLGKGTTFHLVYQNI